MSTRNYALRSRFSGLKAAGLALLISILVCGIASAQQPVATTQLQSAQPAPVAGSDATRAPDVIAFLLQKKEDGEVRKSTPPVGAPRLYCSGPCSSYSGCNTMGCRCLSGSCTGE